MNRYEAVWLGLLAAATAYEIYGLRGRQEATLSEATRRLFHTRTTLGRTVLAVSLVSLGSWYYLHLTKEQ